jgi:hypothetical protein
VFTLLLWLDAKQKSSYTMDNAKQKSSYTMDNAKQKSSYTMDKARYTKNVDMLLSSTSNAGNTLQGGTWKIFLIVLMVLTPSTPYSATK